MNTDSDNKIKPSFWSRDFILMMLSCLFVTFGFQLLLPIMPIFTVSLGGKDSQVGLVIGILTFTALLMRPISGRIMDKHGRRGLYLISLIEFIICVLAYIWTPSIAVLILIRLFHGIGWGSAATGTFTVSSDITPKQRLGEGMAYVGLTQPLAMLAAPAIGMSLLSKYGFNMIFYVAAGATLLAFFVALPIKYLKPQKPEPDKISVEKKSVFEKSAAWPAVVYFFVAMTFGAITTFIPLYAVQKNIPNIGLFYTIYAVALIIARPIFGALVDRKSPTVAVLPGIICVIISMLTLAFANSMLIFLAAGFLYGIGYGAIQPALQAMALRHVSPARGGAANATFFLGLDLGIGTSAILCGIIAQNLGYQALYLLATIPAVCGLLFYIPAIKKFKIASANIHNAEVNEIK